MKKSFAHIYGFLLQLLHTALVSIFMYVLIYKEILRDAWLICIIFAVFLVIMSICTSYWMRKTMKAELADREKEIADLVGFVLDSSKNLRYTVTQIEERVTLVKEYAEKMDALSTMADVPPDAQEETAFIRADTAGTADSSTAKILIYPSKGLKNN